MLETLFSMDITTIAAFMAAAFVLYLTPGADMMFTLASGIKGGPKAGLAAAFGISTGVLVHVILAATGLALLLKIYPTAFVAIRILGAIYLIWLAYKAFADSGEISDEAGRTHALRAFRQGFVTNLLNPKVALFVLSFLPQFTDPSVGPVWQQIIWLGLFLTIGGIITDGAYGVFAGLMARHLRAGAQLMNKLSGAIFSGLALAIILDLGRK